MNKHELIITGNDFIENKVILPFYVDSVINVYSGRFLVYNYYYDFDKKELNLLSERSDVSDLKVIFSSKQLDRDKKINKILND